MSLRVKINDKLYSSEDQPIMLIFEGDPGCHKTKISNNGNCVRYCAYPSDADLDDIEKFMEIENNGETR